MCLQAKELRCCYALACLQLVSETPTLTNVGTVRLMIQAFVFAEFTKFTGIICAKVYFVGTFTVNLYIIIRL